MDVNLKDQDFLLVKEKGSNELHVENVDKEGKIKSTKLNENGGNPDLLKIDKNGNILENFFQNFVRQVKDPTRFEFFHIPAEKFNEAVQKLQEAFKNPDKPESKQLLDLHRIDPEDFLKKQRSYAIDPNTVQWDKLEKFGINRETLEKTGISKDGTNNLDRLLDYRKTNLVTVTLKVDDETTMRTDAKFSLRKQDDGSFAPAIHPIRHKPELDRPYFGVQFTEEDKKNLLTTGNLGRVVDAEFKQGEKTPILLSLDKETNELIAFCKDWLKVPDTYKGIELNEEQKQKLNDGKAVRLENLYSSEKNRHYSANVQFNADKRYFELIFDNKKQEQSQKQGNEQKDVPKTFWKKELTGEQRDSLREGKTVKIDGLVDKKGKPYNGYITINKETGKTDFMFPKQYKDALAAGNVIPDNRHKTQVAVNSEGKTNEATKNLKEPLKQGQNKPDEKQAEKQEETKKRGRKVS